MRVNKHNSENTVFSCQLAFVRGQKESINEQKYIYKK